MYDSTSEVGGLDILVWLLLARKIVFILFKIPFSLDSKFYGKSALSFPHNFIDSSNGFSSSVRNLCDDAFSILLELSFVNFSSLVRIVLHIALASANTYAVIVG